MPYLKYFVNSHKASLGCAVFFLCLFFSVSIHACDDANNDQIGASTDIAQVNHLNQTAIQLGHETTTMNHHNCKGENCEGDCKCSALSCSTIWATVDESKVPIAPMLALRHIELFYNLASPPQPPLFRPPIQNRSDY